MIEFVYEDGRKEMIEEPEEIYTFQGWKQMGFSVKKGEHSIARFPIWVKKKQKTKKKEGEEDAENDDYYYMKVAFFFKKDQVE